MRRPIFQVDCRRGRITVAAVVLAAVCLISPVRGLAAALDFPPLTGRVVDEAQILDAATKSALDSKLAALEAKTSDQLVVVTLKSLRGTTIETYGYQLGRQWGIGQKGRNNGALLIVAPTERKIRIEVGYGLEDRLTDAVARLIIENAIAPRLRMNDFAGGISRGVDDIISVLTEDAQDWQRRANRAARPADHVSGPLDVVIVVFVIAVFIIILNTILPRRPGPGGRLHDPRRQPGWLGPVFLPPSGPFGSGSSGSGDSGGFSGGGGDFGGGGASGDF